MTDLTPPAPPAADVREIRLEQLRTNLNNRYGLELAKWFDADERAALVIARRFGNDDVVVGASVDPETNIYVLEAYTAIAWMTYGDPFQRTERDALERAAAWCLQFVPETPAT